MLRAAWDRQVKREPKHWGQEFGREHTGNLAEKKQSSVKFKQSATYKKE